MLRTKEWFDIAGVVVNAIGALAGYVAIFAALAYPVLDALA